MIAEMVALLVRYALLGWLTALGLFILHQIVAGRIVTMAMVKSRSGESFSFHRLQMIAVTLLFAAGYVVVAIARDPALGMPNIPTPLLGALLGSHIAYLGGKLLT